MLVNNLKKKQKRERDKGERKVSENERKKKASDRMNANGTAKKPKS